MKKVLYLHSGAELYGADIVLLELIKGLDKSKFEPHVLLPNDGPLVDAFKEEGVDVGVLEYPILRRKYFNPIGILQYVCKYRKYSQKIVDYCEYNQIDILHVNTSAVLEGCYIKKRTGLFVICHIHEILTSPKIVVRFIFKLISKYSDRIVCVSRAAEKNFMKISGAKKEKMHVIYNGVDNKKFNLNNDAAYLRKEFGVKGGEIVIGMIGRVNAWKGQKDFVKAMNGVFQRNNKVKAILVGGVFAGQEWRMDELKRIIQESKFRDNFVVSDFRKDTPNLHSLFDVFVLPSTEPDPFPTVVLEAMASGKPGVGYNHGGICEMVDDGKNCLLAEPGNVDDLSVKIESLVKDSSARERIGKNNAKRQKSCFSVSDFVRKFQTIYGEA